MSIIEDIYSNRVNEERIVSSDCMIDKDIYALLERKGYKRENAEISDLLFEASGCGQKHGFHAGFKTAVVLMIECLSY